MSPVSSQRQLNGNIRSPDKQLSKLAVALADSFLSGRVRADTAALVGGLFPGATLVSISVLAGGRLLITEHNLVEAGYVKVSFDRVQQTVAGQAVLNNNLHFASLSKDRHLGLLDLERASTSKGCQNMVSAPIPHRQSRSSVDMQPAHIAKSQSQCNSSTGGPNLPKIWRDVALGSLTVATPAGVYLSSMHLKNLSDLAESLAPVLQRCCGEICSGMESLFCQRDDFEAEAIETEPAFGQDGSWSNAQFVEEYVDAMLCRWCKAKALGPCKHESVAQDLPHCFCNSANPVNTVQAASTA